MNAPFIAGNWKMNKTVKESVDFARQLTEGLIVPPGCDVVIAPTYTALQAVAQILKGTAIHLAAQNVHDQPSGAYTGEISAAMLVDAGCEYVIIGHSERRTLFGETDAVINSKIAAALPVGLRPIFCIGETLAEREQEKTFQIIESQIKAGLHNLSGADIRSIIVAYEPVWAIGTGRTASPGQAQEIHAFIRKTIDFMFPGDIARDLRILYGGSVNPGNISMLMAEQDIDGALVGGASLEMEPFSKIVNFL